jgi:hypothetical protein
MRNKKGKIAAGEIFGMLSWGFIAVVVVLLFWGCEAKREIVKYNTFEDLKTEIEATKALNFFLGMPHPTDSEKMVLDMVIESNRANNYDTFSGIAEGYFGEIYDKWFLYVIDYSNGNNYQFSSGSTIVSQAEVEMKVVDESKLPKIEFVTLNIVFQIRE